MVAATLDERRRLCERLAATLPPRRSGWTRQGHRFTSEGDLGPVVVEADATRRLVRIFWRCETAGVVRPVRLAVGPIRGQRWPERLAEAAVGFVNGRPVEGVPHRELARGVDLIGYAVRWECPKCHCGQLAELAELIADRAMPSPRRCAACGRPAAVELVAQASPVTLRVVT